MLPQSDFYARHDLTPNGLRHCIGYRISWCSSVSRWRNIGKMQSSRPPQLRAGPPIFGTGTRPGKGAQVNATRRTRPRESRRVWMADQGGGEG